MSTTPSTVEQDGELRRSDFQGDKKAGRFGSRYGQIKQSRRVILTPFGVKTVLGYGSQRLEDHLPSWKGGEDAGLLGPENLEVDGQRGDNREQPGQSGAGRRKADRVHNCP